MAYIHPDSRIIEEFINENIHDRRNLKTITEALLTWFDQNAAYGRLNAPFFPLQRCDLDVISMRSGTCGDYSNLIVSVLLKLGYEALYAYVHRDCYGDEQDHICAAARDRDEWILIDATLPYRKWYGFRCPHREYELLSPHAFERRMREEETYWTGIADRYGNARYAGLLYAPWIHDRIIRQTDTVLDSAFFLLSADRQRQITVYVYWLHYTKEKGSVPVMCVISENGRTYRFSSKEPNGIWDHAQWGEEYPEEDIPEPFRTEMLSAFQKCISEDYPAINRIILDATDP